jgi:hypothetical protein
MIDNSSGFCAESNNASAFEINFGESLKHMSSQNMFAFGGGQEIGNIITGMLPQSASAAPPEVPLDIATLDAQAGNVNAHFQAANKIVEPHIEVISAYTTAITLYKGPAYSENAVKIYQDAFHTVIAMNKAAETAHKSDQKKFQENTKAFQTKIEEAQTKISDLEKLAAHIIEEELKKKLPSNPDDIKLDEKIPLLGYNVQPQQDSSEFDNSDNEDSSFHFSPGSDLKTGR